MWSPACGSGTLVLEQAGIETTRWMQSDLLAAVLAAHAGQLMLEPHRRLAAKDSARSSGCSSAAEQREPCLHLERGVYWSLPFSVSSWRPGAAFFFPEREYEVAAAALGAWGEMVRRGTGECRVPQCRAHNSKRQASKRQAQATGARRGTDDCRICVPGPARGRGSGQMRFRRRASCYHFPAGAPGRAQRTRNSTGSPMRITSSAGSLPRHRRQSAGRVHRPDVANPPYIPTGELVTLRPEVQGPRLALDGGADGPRVAREIVETSPSRIRPGGFLLLRSARMQSRRRSRSRFAASGQWEPARVRCDLAGRPRVVVARRRQCKTDK